MTKSLINKIISITFLFIVLGGSFTRAWGRTSSVNTAALWESSTYDAGDSVVWSAPNVTFKLHNGGDIVLYSSDHILIQKNRHYTLEWRVADGYTINVAKVSVKARATLQSYITVGTNKSDNIYGQSYTTVNSQALSLGNAGTVDIYPESDRDASIVHINEITVTYTINGVEKEVTFDGTDNWSTVEKYEPDSAFVVQENHVKFCLYKPMRQYNKYSWFSFSSHEYFYLEKSGSSDVTSQLRWWVAEGYTINVLSISTSAKNGNGYVWTSRMLQSARKVIAQKEGSWTSHTYAVSDESNNLFGATPTALGNNEYFNIDVTTKGTSNQLHIKTIDLNYTINPNSYDITLNNETPTTEVTTSVSVTYDSNSQLSIDNPTKDGYTFDGWYTAETDGNGSGTKVIDVEGNLQANVTGYTGANGVWKKDATTTLYAKWILNGIKDIMLDNQGATTSGTDSMSVRFMTNHYSKASITIPAKNYYTFDGYYSASSGGVQVIDAEGNIVADVEGYTDSDKKWINGDDETTLYAHWTGISYSVRFNGNGSTGGSMDNQAFVYGTAQNLTSNAFEKTCTVTYDANGGSCGIASSETPFSFLGWTTSEGGDVVYANSAEVENLASTSGAIVDLYAVWSTSASEVMLPTPTKANSVFKGWYNADDVLAGKAGDSYTPSDNETLNAHWNPGVNMTISDLDDGDLVVTTEHAIFTLHSDGYAITDYKDGYGFYVWKPLSKNTTKNVTLSWVKTIADGDYTLHVTSISFKAKAYNSNAGVVNKGKISFNGGDSISIGTAHLGTEWGWSSTIGGAGDYESGVVIQLINTSDIIWETFDYHFKDFQIEYTITPNAPTPHNADLAGTLNESAKQKLDVRIGTGDLFTMTSPAADFKYTYRLKEDYASAHLEDGYFWATATGDYEIQARVTSAEDHEASAWSTSTVHVLRTCVFNNSTSDKDWNTNENWVYNATPTATDAVQVSGDLIIDGQIEMLSLSIEEDAVVEVAPTGGLTVGAGGISGATTENLILKAGTAGATKGQTGYLRISPDYTGEMPQASVELYSVVHYNTASSGDNAATYQCVGAPIEGVPAKSIFQAGSYLYTWDESEDAWVNSRTKLTLEAFKGFDVTQKKNAAGFGFTYGGQLLTVHDVKTIDLSYSGEEKGSNLLANSFTAPIDIDNFIDDDFVNAEKTIYILNAGTKANSDAPAGGIDAPGKWIGMPIATVAELAASGYPRMIAPMQGFWVKATGEGAQLTLDYSRLVWDVDYSGVCANKPLRAPKRTAELDEEEKPITGKLQVNLYSDTEKDFFFMLESERYDAAYENGYDAKKIPSGSMDVFTVEGENELGVDATNSIIGTRVGVRTGGESVYTFVFSHLSGEHEWALYDHETGDKTDINEGTEYTFFAEPYSLLNGRFEIVERADAPSVTTGVDGADNEVKAYKFIKDNQLYILKNGVLYNVMGGVVR